jgi:hypothetical protein
MSAADATSAEVPDHPVLLEQWLFMVSPLGTLSTTLLLYAALMGSFAVAAAADGVAVFSRTAQGLAFASNLWPALVLSLLMCVALGLQRNARLKEIADGHRMSEVLRCRDHYLAQMCDAPAMRRTRMGGAIGAFTGLGMSFLVTPPHLPATSPAVFAWFCAATIFMGVLFGRGVSRSILGAENFAQAIDNDMTIDLLRTDRLAVIGRNGARNALIWFSICAVLLLFFAGRNMAPVTLGMLVVSAVMGIWIFVRPMERVHRRIAAAKRAELDHIRSEIALARAALSGDPQASAKLQGLLAYEHRIEAVREWPFDQSTVVRLAAYVFIPAIPWFGQAIAQYFVDHLAVG